MILIKCGGDNKKLLFIQWNQILYRSFIVSSLMSTLCDYKWLKVCIYVSVYLMLVCIIIYGWYNIWYLTHLLGCKQNYLARVFMDFIFTMKPLVFVYKKHHLTVYEMKLRFTIDIPFMIWLDFILLIFFVLFFDYTQTINY